MDVDYLPRQILMRARRLRAQGQMLCSASFASRKQFFNHKESGIFKERPATDPMAAALNNPMMVDFRLIFALI